MYLSRFDGWGCLPQMPCPYYRKENAMNKEYYEIKKCIKNLSDKELKKLSVLIKYSLCMRADAASRHQKDEKACR